MRVSGTSRPCNGIYERIIAGEKPADMLYSSMEHGVSAFLAKDMASEGHTLIVPHECVAGVDDLPPKIHRNVFVVARYVGRAIDRAFNTNPDDSVGEMVSGQEIKHTHIHRFRISETDDGRVWRRFAGTMAFRYVSDAEHVAEFADLQTAFVEEQTAMEAELAGERLPPLIVLAETATDLWRPKE